MSAERITFTRHVDAVTGGATVTVDRWPREVEVDAFVFASANPSIMRFDGDELTITVSNGRAVYELGELDVLTQMRRGRLVSCRLSEP